MNVAGRVCRSDGGRRWIRLAAVNTAAALTVAVMLTVVGSGRSFLTDLVTSLIFSHTIGSLAGLVLPPVARRLDWNRVRLAWLVLTAMLLAVAVVGCVVAALVIVGVGLVPPAYLGSLLATSLRICALITLGFGGGMTVYEVMRARLEATTAELRAKEVERERVEKLAAEARLASLESRLHPHFLFNTLNAISALIPEDPARAEELVEQLAALLRFSLDAGERHTVPLGAELAIVRAYLGIEQARLGDRLRCAIEVADELEACLVPPLALHTVVQNSVKHVAAARSGPTEIRVRGDADNGRLRLAVWDAGAWFPLDTLPAGHGLDTLRARLDVLYRGEGRLAVDRVDGGKTVSITLPIRLGDSERPPNPPIRLGDSERPPNPLDVSQRLRAFLVDDEPLALTRLARLLAATGRVDVVGRAGDAAEARAALAHLGADVVFLDIHMPGMSGLELAERLPRSVAIIFTTAYDQHALAAFEANAVDYLLKPIERKRLDRALDKLERLRDDPLRADTTAILERLAAALRVAPAPFVERLPFRTRDGIQLIDVTSVTHFIARDRLTHAVTATGDHVVDFGLADLEAKLDPAKFQRIHRAALLNLDHVAEIQPWPGGRLLVRLKGPGRTELEVSRDRVRALKDRLGL